MNRCMLCGSEQKEIIHKGTRGREDIDVYRCTDCGLVYLSGSISDINMFYSNSGMRYGETDIKEILREAYRDDKRRFDFVETLITNKKVLDFGCGAGGFLDLAKTRANEVVGVELETLMRDHINKSGIKCFSTIDDIPDDYLGEIDVITMFHVLEHLDKPIEILSKMFPLLRKGGRIIIEVPNADDALLSLYGCKAFADFTYWECHLFLYTNETLSKLVQKTRKYKVSFVRQIQRYNLSNTLYWLTNGKPGGHEKWCMMNEEALDNAYGDMLAKLGKADTIVMEIIKEEDSDEEKTHDEEVIVNNKKVFDIPKIKLFLSDCDGCLTDGGMYYSELGDEMKKFNTRDGMGFRLLQEKGIITGVITGENVDLNKRRAQKMQLDYFEGGCDNKAETIKRICNTQAIDLSNVCYIGDDINDIEVLKLVGFGCSPSDASNQVKAVAKYITKASGGNGVIREIADLILREGAY